MLRKIVVFFFITCDLIAMNGKLAQNEEEDKLGIRLDRKLDKCQFPCSCSDNTKFCNNCKECTRQIGQTCNKTNDCDTSKHLECKFLPGDITGICTEKAGLPCKIKNKTYEHGETFLLDCRTQCTCQNGTYGCSSLCPQEQIHPEGPCKHPRLVDIPQQCCREWLCDSQTVDEPPQCKKSTSSWTNCSSECGSGLSLRESNENSQCKILQEFRLCQVRQCDSMYQPISSKNNHKIRKGHECKATYKSLTPMYLEVGPCRTKKKYRPKFCNFCSASGVTCIPLLSTTVKIDFVCDAPFPRNGRRSNLIFKNIQQGKDMWVKSIKNDSNFKTQVSASVQWILRCVCEAKTNFAENSTKPIALHRIHRAI